MRVDNETAALIFAALRQWGWSVGLAKLRAAADAATDGATAAARRFLAGLAAAERGKYQAAREFFDALAAGPECGCAALVGQAFLAICQSGGAGVEPLLDQAAAEAGAGDDTLRAMIGHYRGKLRYREDRLDEALALWCAALKSLGPDHFLSGRILDSLGMYYAARDNFAAARALLEKSIVLKRRFADDAGLAIAYGNLGRLYLDWGLLDQAEAAFNEDLRLAEQVEDSRGAAQMYNSLGRVELERGNWAAAAAYLAHSVEAARPIEARVLEGFARRDLAWALAMQGNFPAAEEQAQAAGELFQSLGFQEGLAHVDWAWGRIFRLGGRAPEAQPRLQSAYRYFHTSGQWVAAARTRLEIAQALRAAGASDKVVLRELQEAIALAERTRHDRIVTAVENELRDCSEVEYYRQLYRRAQGRDRPEERVSLTDGVRETASVLFLDLRGSTQYGLETDPEIVMTDFNQMMAGFAAVLKAEGVTICGYRGDGFMALARGRDHARRAVRAALKLFAALADFNRPRELLELAPLEVRIGINTGEVFLGNVGTYEKMEFAALGTAANLGARIESAAQPGLPAIGESTYQQVRRHCEFAPGNPRRVQAKGFQEGEIAVWDVLRCGES